MVSVQLVDTILMDLSKAFDCLNNIYSCPNSVNDVIENLQSDLKIVLKWLKNNQMRANLGKFLFMILSKNTINKSIIIDNETIE